MKRELLLCVATAIVLNLFSASFVMAQEEITQEYAMAQKREEKNIQDIPVSISVLRDTQIEDADIESTTEIDPYVPNFTTFSYADTPFSIYSIRGLHNMIQHTRPVGTYIDDMPVMTTSYITDSKVIEAERIEVLKGPQGNLYGVNSVAGIVNIITKKPSNTWIRKVTIGLGNYKTQSYRALVSGPMMKDILFLSLAGMYYNQSDGYINVEGSRPDDRESATGRGQIRCTPTEELDILFTLTGENQDDGMWRFVPKDDDPFDTPNKNVDEYAELDVNMQSLRIKYMAPWFEVTSISARYEEKVDELRGMDFSALDLMKFHYRGDDTNWSQEIRLSSTESESPLKWFVGGYYFHGDMNYPLTMFFDGSLFDSTTSPGFVSILDIYNAGIKTDTYSVFSQVSYGLFEKLRLTAGLRYDRDQKEIDSEHYMETKIGGVSMGVTPVSSYEGSRSWDAWSPKFIVDYRFTPSVLSYASVAHGYKSGGFEVHNADTIDQAQFDPEDMWSCEAGVKTNWLDNRFILNAAMFYTKVEDLQVFKFSNIGLPKISKAEEATLWGFEAELQTHPTPRLDIIASFGYLNTQFDECEDPFNPAGPQNYKDNKLTLSPEYEVSLVTQYRLPWGLCARVEYLRRGDTYYNEANTFKQDAYNLVNTRIGCKKEDFDIYFYINNIFDKEYYTYLLSFPPAVTTGSIGDPQTFGVQARIFF